MFPCRLRPCCVRPRWGLPRQSCFSVGCLRPCCLARELPSYRAGRPSRLGLRCSPFQGNVHIHMRRGGMHLHRSWLLTWSRLPVRGLLFRRWAERNLLGRPSAGLHSLGSSSLSEQHRGI